MSDPALKLLAHLRLLGVRLAIEGDRLLVDAPRGVVDTDLRGEIRAHKGAIIAALRSAKPRSSPVAAGCRLGDSPEPARVPISPKRLEANSEDGAMQCDEHYDKANSRNHDALPSKPSESEPYADGLSGDRGSAGWPAIPDGLPKAVAELATARHGWTAVAWRRRLNQLADACRSVNPARAEELCQAARLFDGP